MRFHRWLAIMGLIAAFFTVPAGALAETTVDLSLGPLTGAHSVSSVERSSTLSESLSGTPFPFLKVTSGGNAVDAYVETVPPFGPQSLGADLDTKLSLIDFLVRYHPVRFAGAGIGEAVLNQATLYPVEGFHQQSRIVGVRYAAFGSPLIAKGRVDLEFAFVPSLHGNFQTFVPENEYRFPPPGSPLEPGSPIPFTTILFGIANTPEIGSETDATARYAITLGARSSLFAGVRYFNYQARYAGTGILADRNTIVYPFVGFSFHFGRR